MQKSLYTSRALASIAALALLLGGVSVAPAAFAAGTVSAPTDDAGYQEFVQQLIATDPAISSVSIDAHANIVVAAPEGTLAESTIAWLDTYDNVVVKDRPVVQSYAIDDVVGGAGYAVNRSSVCSFGFSAWSDEGDPAIITAGHCGQAGAVIERTLPSQDDAPYFPGREPSYSPALLDPVGTIVFSQWGGPGHTPGSEGDLDSTDIAVIDVTNPDLALRPLVTDWRSWESGDLSLSGTSVTAVGTVEIGDIVSRSGRSTGVTGGTVLAAESEIVVESKSWTRVCEIVLPVPSNCHWVYGFWTNADSRPGDSGGPYLRGTTAVGLLSGGGSGMTFAADLSNALRLTPGYTVMLDLAEPTVTSGATVAPGGLVQGTGGAGLTLSVTMGTSTTEVAIGADGTWSFPAPTTAGAVSYLLSTHDDGFNRSDDVIHALVVDPALLPRPVITTPAADAAVVGQSVTFAGTGAPAATITLIGGASASTVVADDGTWSVTTDLDYGAASVTATQTIYGESATTDVAFDVVPAAPTLTSPVHGAVLAASPTVITGSALPGATVTVRLDGTALPPVVVPAARATVLAPVSWSVTIPSTVGPGAHALAVTQTINSVTSAAVESTFTVQAAPVPSPEPPGDGDTPAPGPLANTGLESSATAMPMLLGGLLLFSATILLLVSRRRSHRA